MPLSTVTNGSLFTETGAAPRFVHLAFYFCYTLNITSQKGFWYYTCHFYAFFTKIVSENGTDTLLL